MAQCSECDMHISGQLHIRVWEETQSCKFHSNVSLNSIVQEEVVIEPLAGAACPT